MINFDIFPNGKRKALTMSYDDGKIYDKKLIDIFNKYGVKGTFHINAGLLDTDGRIKSNELKSLYENHEIAAHGFTHQSLGITPKENIIYNIMEDRKKLESLLKYPVRGMSYPNGSYNNQTIECLKSCGIEYCRIIETYSGTENFFSSNKKSRWHGFDVPNNFFTWKATCHHDENLIEIGKSFLEQSRKNRPYLMYVWGHSIEFEKNNNWNLIKEFCKMVSQNKDIWYATNIEIVDYINALKNLKFAADLSFVLNNSSIDTWISIDEKIMKIPAGKITTIKER